MRLRFTRWEENRVQATVSTRKRRLGHRSLSPVEKSARRQENDGLPHGQEPQYNMEAVMRRVP